MGGATNNLTIGPFGIGINTTPSTTSARRLRVNGKSEFSNTIYITSSDLPESSFNFAFYAFSGGVPT